MGYHGDVAFGIVVQNSGAVDGGPRDGPLIGRFFDALNTSLGHVSRTPTTSRADADGGGPDGCVPRRRGVRLGP